MKRQERRRVETWRSTSLIYAYFSLFDTFTWVTRMSDEPVFESAPALAK